MDWVQRFFIILTVVGFLGLLASAAWMFYS
jgi:hypothetical protein